MNFLRNNTASLENIAMMKLAVELCHNYKNLKIAILCFPQTAYDGICGDHYNKIPGQKVCERIWGDVMERQANSVCEVILLRSLKPKLITCIRAIALQWLSWAKQQEKMFGLPQQYCSNFVMPEDWTVGGRLNERKLAERLVQDQSTDVVQRYRIACTYFLESFIRDLWEQIPELQKKQFCDTDSPDEIKEHELVNLWSNHSAGTVENVISNENRFWQCGLSHAVETGIIEGVIYCWNKLRDIDKKKIGIQVAFNALEIWIYRKNCGCTHKLINDCKTWFRHKTYYSNILCFLLSQMRQEEQISFFREAFENEFYSHVLDCLLEWPFQDLFMPTIIELWGILPEEIYGETLLSLTYMYTHENDHDFFQKLNQDYDYRSLLLTLWEQTPKYYRCYLFNDSSDWMGKDILLELLMKQPFDKKAIAVFQYILKQAIDEGKRTILSILKDLCEDVILENGLKFFCCMLEFLSEDSIRDFKQNFILSDIGRSVCFFAVCDGGEEEAYANLLIEWGMLSSEEISEFKHELIFDEQFLFASADFLLVGKIDCVERIMCWCLPNEEIQYEFRAALANDQGIRICCSFLKQLKWGQLEEFLTWCFTSEDDIEQFKQRLFLIEGINIHFYLMSESHWQEADLFFKWCSLSPGAIKKFKNDTLFSDECITEVIVMLCDLEQECHLKNGKKWESIALYLRWGLSDVGAVLSFEEEIFRSYDLQVVVKDLKNLESFHGVIQERLCELECELYNMRKQESDVLEE